MTDYSAYQEATPPTAALDDNLAYNVGMEFSVDEEVWYLGGSFWQPTTNTPSNSLRTLSLWSVDTADTGTLLWSKIQSGAPVSGWNEVLHDEPFQLTPGQRYKQCTHHPNGRYTGTGGYYSTGDGGSNLVVGPLTVYNSGNSISGQGTFVQSASLLFPDTEFGSANYWNDVLLTDVDPNPVSDSLLDTISDRARAHLLSELGLPDTYPCTNVDLVRMLLEDGSQTLIPVTHKSVAGHYEDYLQALRDE